jgi:hypothetical protein
MANQHIQEYFLRISILCWKAVQSVSSNSKVVSLNLIQTHRTAALRGLTSDSRKAGPKKTVVWRDPQCTTTIVLSVLYYGTTIVTNYTNSIALHTYNHYSKLNIVFFRCYKNPHLTSLPIITTLTLIVVPLVKPSYLPTKFWGYRSAYNLG